MPGEERQPRRSLRPFYELPECQGPQYPAAPTPILGSRPPGSLPNQEGASTPARPGRTLGAELRSPVACAPRPRAARRPPRRLPPPPVLLPPPAPSLLPPSGLKLAGAKRAASPAAAAAAAGAERRGTQPQPSAAAEVVPAIPAGRPVPGLAVPGADRGPPGRPPAETRDSARLEPRPRERPLPMTGRGA